MTLRPNAVWTHSRRTGRPARTLGGPRAALLQRRRPRSSLTPRRCFPQRGSPLRPLPLLRQARSRERKRSPGARNGPRRAPRFGRRRAGPRSLTAPRSSRAPRTKPPRSRQKRRDGAAPPHPPRRPAAAPARPAAPRAARGRSRAAAPGAPRTRGRGSP